MKGKEKTSKRPTQADLEAAVELLSTNNNVQFSSCFDNFINLALSFFCNNMNEEQMKLRKLVDTDSEFKEKYIKAFQIYGELADDYCDPIGDMFMNRISHGSNGQFFTPEDITTMMNELVGVNNRDSLSDPACGSGRTLLSGLKIARKDGNEPLLYGNDLSMTCAKMTLLNFCTNSADGAVSCGDTLTLDKNKFYFFHIDKLIHLSTGIIFSSYWQYDVNTIDDVTKKRNEWWQWLAKLGWVKYYHIKADESPKEPISEPNSIEEIQPLSTDVKVSENGQISLF